MKRDRVAPWMRLGALAGAAVAIVPGTGFSQPPQPADVAPRVSCTASGRSQAQDPETIRKEASRTDLTPEERLRLFREMQMLVYDEKATPDRRILDASVAIEVVGPVDPKAAAAYSDEWEKIDWIGKASPATRGWFACARAYALILAQRPKDAVALLDRVKPEEIAQPNVRTYHALGRFMAARGLGDDAKGFEYRAVLDGAVGNRDVQPRLRAEAAGQLMAGYVLDENDAALKSLVLRSLPLTDAGTEPSDFLRASILSLPIYKDDYGAFTTPPGKKPKTYWEIREDMVAGAAATEKKYGLPSRTRAKYVSSWAICNLKLRFGLAPEDVAPVLTETLNLLADLRGNFRGMVEPETTTVLEVAARATFDQPHEALQAYRTFDALPLDESNGSRYARRLAALVHVYQLDPAYGSEQWLRAMRAFATSIRNLALKDPDTALRSLRSWDSNWRLYEGVPRSGHAEEFLDGYVQATGIVKNVPFAKRAEGVDAARVYGEVGLKDVQNELSAQQPMAVYVRFDDPKGIVGKNASYAGFLLQGRGKVKYVPLGPAATIDAAIHDWEASMRGSQEAPAVGNPRKNGARLYDLLLRPLIGDHVPQDLIVVPDGEIGKVSFAVAVTPRNKWLVEETTLSYLGAMRDAVTSPVGGATPPLVLTATKFSSQHKLDEPLKSVAALKRLDKGTRKASLSPGALAGLRHPRVLQISTHGKYESADLGDPQTIANAAWMMVPSRKGDLKVTARDVARWDLRGTQLAVLASCDGGRADVLSGEGTGGLRRALFLAGAGQVIAAQSHVYKAPGDAAPGDGLLTAVYDGLRQGKSPAESLRAAQRRMIAAKVAPYCWAGFLCEGSTK